MNLVTRGRLSVQRVGEDAWAAIELMAENGGWEELNIIPNKKGGKVKGLTSSVDNQGKEEKSKSSSSITKLDKVKPQEKDRSHDDEDESKDDEEVHIIAKAPTKRKRGATCTNVDIGDTGLRRSRRVKK